MKNNGKILMFFIVPSTEEGDDHKHESRVDSSNDSGDEGNIHSSDDGNIDSGDDGNIDSGDDVNSDSWDDGNADEDESGCADNDDNVMVGWLSGGVTPCRHLRPSSGREHTIVTYSVR